MSAATSDGTASQFVISMASAIRSVTCGPIMWMPRTGPSSASAITFTIPPSPTMFALPIARKSSFSVTTWCPRSTACASVRPTEAISGVEYVTRGMLT